MSKTEIEIRLKEIKTKELRGFYKTGVPFVSLPEKHYKELYRLADNETKSKCRESDN